MFARGQLISTHTERLARVRRRGNIYIQRLSIYRVHCSVMMSARDVVKRYFKQDKGTEEWTCTCGKKLKQRHGTGYTNLFNHIKSQHKDWDGGASGQKTLDGNVIAISRDKTISDSVENLYSWVEWVCVGMKPFSFVEDELTRKYSSLQPICTKTLKKYMSLLTTTVEREISKLLPERFAIIIDGWSKSSTHFLAVFASFPSNEENGYSTVLLAFSPLFDETSFTAKAQYDFVVWVIENVFKRSLTDVVAVIGDNCETNKAMCNLGGFNFVGCASHRFNLAVKKLLEEHEPLLVKVNALMSKLKNLKLSGALRKHTDLRPIQRNVTRWSSTAQMVDRYLALKPFFVHFVNQQELDGLWLSARENRDLSDLHETLERLNSITKALQSESTNQADVRVLFDEVLKIHSSMATHLASDAKIVHSVDFECGIVKLLDGKDDSLTQNEEKSLASLMIASDSTNEKKVDAEDDFAGALLKRRKIERAGTTMYMDCRFILPTSNIVERFFSTAGFTFGDLRQSLLPLNLEMQLFLKVNKAHWNKDIFMQAVEIDKSKDN